MVTLNKRPRPLAEFKKKEKKLQKKSYSLFLLHFLWLAVKQGTAFPRVWRDPVRGDRLSARAAPLLAPGAVTALRARGLSLSSLRCRGLSRSAVLAPRW